MNKEVKQYVKKLKKIADKGTFEISPNKNKLTVKWKMMSACGVTRNITCHMPKKPSCHRWKKNSIAYLNRTFNEMNIQSTIN